MAGKGRRDCVVGFENQSPLRSLFPFSDSAIPLSLVLCLAYDWVSFLAHRFASVSSTAGHYDRNWERYELSKLPFPISIFKNAVVF